MCDQFWNALDESPALRRLHLPFDYGLDTHPVLTRLYCRLHFIYHRSKGERPAAESDEERRARQQAEAMPREIGHMTQCCMMDRDGQLGQFLLRFDRTPVDGNEPGGPRSIGVSGMCRGRDPVCVGRSHWDPVALGGLTHTSLVGRGHYTGWTVSSDTLPLAHAP